MQPRVALLHDGAHDSVFEVVVEDLQLAHDLLRDLRRKALHVSGAVDTPVEVSLSSLLANLIDLLPNLRKKHAVLRHRCSDLIIEFLILLFFSLIAAFYD